jgi:hypothetical protein
MRSQQLYRLSSAVLILLALTALITVVTGFIRPPAQPELDEGTQAHVFQLSITGLLPITVLVVGTADWRRPARSAWPLIVAAAATAVAFAGLYYLEHFRQG